ncbi:unnamed protein product [Symbiodinium sp. CCMP2592]|nr:unnamed protein product [Symbiodinium sp. CCMP2592]
MSLELHVVVESLGSNISEGISNLQVRPQGPPPEPADGFVTIEVYAASVNFPDLLMTCGGYQYRPKLPYTPGTEAAGIIRAVGKKVSSFSIGQRVMVSLPEGCMASWVSAPAAACTALPPRLSFREGAAFTVAFTTAYHCLVERARVSAADCVLVNGATGGVGLAAIQVARALKCRKIIATGRGREKLEVVERLGATCCFNLEEVSLAHALKTETDGRGVDVVFDTIGGEVFEESLRGTAWGARVLVVGFASGKHPSIRANYALIKGLTIMGCRAGESARRDPSLHVPRMKQLLDWVAAGEICPHVSHEFAVEDVEAAFRTVLERRVIGKAVAQQLICQGKPGKLRWSGDRRTHRRDVADLKDRPRGTVLSGNSAHVAANAFTGEDRGRYGQGYEQDGAKWSLWPGSYKASPRGGRSDKPQTPSFPAYDAAWKKSAEVMEVPQAPSAPSGGRGIVRDVQGAVNAARKLEQKLAKTQKEMLQKGQAWDSWVLSMRSSYQKEYERHRAEQRRLSLEIKDLEEQTQFAYSQVQLCATHKVPTAAAPPPLDWEIPGVEEALPELTEDQTRAELQRILAKAPPGLTTPTRAETTAPRSPTGNAAPTATSAMEVSPPAAAPRDPYITTMPPTPAPHGAPGKTMGLIDPRQPLPQDRATAPSALADKLSEKRRAYRSAMAPFGYVRKPDVDNMDRAALSSERTGRDTGQLFVDDDYDDLQAMPSPGFGAMDITGEHVTGSAPVAFGALGNRTVHCLLMAPDFVSEQLALTVEAPILTDVFMCQAVAESRLLPRLSSAHLVPVRPQPEEGYATFVICPDWTSPARKASVILDFWDLGGPTYARIVNPQLTFKDLEDEASRHGFDRFDAYLGGDDTVLNAASVTTIADGTLVTFMRVGLPPRWHQEIDRFLMQPEEWIDSPRCMRLEQHSDHWLVIRPDCTKLMAYSTESDYSLQEVIATQMHQYPINVNVRMPVSEARLEVVFDGYHVSKIIAATPRSVPAPDRAESDTFVFLDARQMGQGITFHLTSTPLLTLREAAESLDTSVAPGFRVYAEHPRLQVEGLAVSNGDVLTLGFELDPNPSHACEPTGTAPIPAEVPHLASTFDELPFTTGPSEAARLYPDRPASVPTSRTVGCIVLAPAHTPEKVEVELNLPCSVHAAGQAIALARDERGLIRVSFTSPPEIGSPGLPFLIRLGCKKGDTVTILPPGTPLGLMTSLENLLETLGDRDVVMPSFPGPAPAAFGVLSDEGLKVHAIDLTQVRSGAVFKQVVGTKLNYDLSATLFRPASPKISNFAHVGQCCQAVFVVTEAIPRRIEAADESTGLIILILDLRALLRGFDWRIHEGNRLHLGPLVQEFSQHKPVGYEVVITGGASVDLGGETGIQIHPGCVITIEYYHDALADPVTPDIDSADIPDGEEDDEEEEVLPLTRVLALEAALHLHVEPVLGILILTLGLPLAAAASATPLSSDRHNLHILPAALVVALASFGVRYCKWLAEPTTNSESDRASLAALRYAAPRLGMPWRYLPAHDAQHIASEGESVSDSSEDDDSVRWVHFAVAAPGYTLERLLTAVRLPATIQETEAAVSNARAQDDAVRFPLLVLMEHPLHGWTAVRVTQSRVTYAALCATHTSYVPSGWKPVLLGIPEDTEYLHVQPGQVIAIVLRRLDLADLDIDFLPRASPDSASPVPASSDAPPAQQHASETQGAHPHDQAMQSGDSPVEERFNTPQVSASEGRPATSDELPEFIDGLPVDQGHQVYAHDLPWPLPDGMLVDFAHGDAVIILAAASGHFTTISFEEMLQSAAGWNPSWTPNLDQRHFAWVLSHQRPFLFHVEPGRILSLRRDIARYFGVSLNALAIHAPDPAISDFSHLGKTVQGVIAVSFPSARQQPSAARPITFFLDCRPLLLGVSWRSSEDGWLRAEGPTPFHQFYIRMFGNATGPSPLGAPTKCASSGFLRTPGRQAMQAQGDQEPMPIPTPARAWVSHLGDDSHSQDFLPCEPTPACSSDIPDKEDLRTLLEECVADPASEAFFLAATLLETLVENQGDPPFRLTLNLQEQIPQHTQPSSSVLGQGVFFGETPLGFTWQQLFQLRHTSVALTSWHEVIHHPDFWQETDLDARAVRATQQAVQDGHSGILCYTDGSFTPTSGNVDAYAGWACIFVDTLSGHKCASFGKVPDWILGPSEYLSAYSAECFALTIAALASWLVFPDRPVTFLSDCVSALKGAEGSYVCRPGGCAQAMSHSFDLRRGLCDKDDRFIYVPGHQGCYFNEVADLLAKAGSRTDSVATLLCLPESTLEFWLSSGAGLLPWAATVLRQLKGDASLPPQGSRDLGDDTWHQGLSYHQMLAPFMPAEVEKAPDGQMDTPSLFSMDLCIASFNTLSLGAGLETDSGAGSGCQGLHQIPARAALLARQLQDCGVDVAALQETRCPQGFSKIGGFLRYSGGADKGHHGTELWFREGSRVLRTCSGNLSDAIFAERHFSILHADPRRIIARYSAGKFVLVFCSLHAPHRATERQLLLTWWQDTQKILSRHRRNDPVVIAGDMNCSVGSIPSPHVSDFGQEEEDTPGEFFHELLRTNQCWVPCTFETCQDGPTATFFQKRNGRPCRPDFISVPSSWQHGFCRSWVDHGIQVATNGIDHVATLLHSQVSMSMPGKCNSKGRARLPRQMFTDPALKPDIQRVLASVPQVPWHTSVHAHAAIVVQHLQQELAQVAPIKQSRPHHVYLQDATWALQKRVSSLKRGLSRLQQHVRTAALAFCFDLWAGTGASTVCTPWSGAWTERALTSMILHMYRIRVDSKALRTACQQDRAMYTNALAERLATGPTSEVHDALHKLLRHKRKKTYAPEPLPQVKDAQGHVCPDAPSALKRWREYFAAMEAGTTMAPSELGPCLDVGSILWPAPQHVGDLPTKPDLVRLMLSAKCGKAPGMDGLPNELLRGFAANCAEILFPLMMKLVFRGQEAMGLKGGMAVWFHKGRGAKDLCESFRQIILLPCFAKILHQAVRPALCELYVRRSPSLQLGGKPGQSVCFGAHLVRSFLRYNWGRKRSCFVLFSDIASAFYAVVRQLVAAPRLEGEASQDIPESVCKGLGISEDELEILRQHVKEQTGLQRAGASPWLEALSQQLSDRSWFMLKDDSSAVLTARGTRPGSSWADIMFGMLMGRVLDERDALEGLDDHSAAEAPRIPWDGQKVLTECSEQSETIPLGDLIWADDTATMRLCRANSRLDAAIAACVGSTCDAFANFGFRMSFGPNKTAVLAQASGPGSRTARRTLFGPVGHKGVIQALRESSQPVGVPLIATYRHLGVFQATRGCMLAEIRYRTAQAWAAFSEGRRKIYKAKGVPIHRRAFILKASVLPKLLYGCGSWPPLQKRELQSFGGTLWSLYRAICGIPASGDQHFHASTVLALTGLPGPVDLLHVQRLLYLRLLVTQGPNELWAAVRADIAYLTALRNSLDWLFSWTHQTSSLQHPLEHWTKWRDFICDQPGRYKGLILRAQALANCRHRVIAALDGLYRALRDQDVPPCVLRAEERMAQSEDFVAICLPAPAALPIGVPGSFGEHAPSDTCEDLSSVLLSELHALPVCDESVVWDTVIEVIEPLQVLRATVRRWANDRAEDEWIQRAADNVILLLDPELIGEPSHASRVKVDKQTFASDSCPTWAPLPSFHLPACTAGPRFDLQPPPPVTISPFVPTSTSLRLGLAYSDWLEQACSTLAKGFELAINDRCDFQVRCDGLAHGAKVQGLVDSGMWQEGQDIQSLVTKSAEDLAEQLQLKPLERKRLMAAVAEGPQTQEEDGRTAELSLAEDAAVRYRRLRPLVDRVAKELPAGLDPAAVADEDVAMLLAILRVKSQRALES